MVWWDTPGAEIFTDESKLDRSAGAGVFCRKLGLELHFRLNDDCSVFQSEIFAILKAIEATVGGPTSYSKSYMIFVDSQAAIALVWCKSQLVCECKESLRTFGPYRIRLCWVPSHSGIFGNEMANAVARVSLLSGCNLVVGSATPTVSSMDGSERKSRGVGGSCCVFTVYGLLKTVSEHVGCWAWIRPV